MQINYHRGDDNLQSIPYDTWSSNTFLCKRWCIHSPQEMEPPFLVKPDPPWHRELLIRYEMK